MVYAQSNAERKFPHHFDVACALYGCMDSGMEYRLTSFEEVQSGKFDSLIRSNLFVGSVEFMREVFGRIGKNPRVPENSDRPYETLLVDQVRGRVQNSEKIFVKPFEIKQFTGMVVDTMTISCLKDLDGNLEVMVYLPFASKIVSEWRSYILHGKIMDCRNYAGDFFVAPSREYIEDRIKWAADNGFPSAYTIDVAVLENGEHVVAECNDFWAIGNYGMENATYIRMLRERYFEIIKT